ncbi:MAG TPA: prolyl oligopeptidase family serine peptidase [Chthoniobacterales bacterium]|jgi:prolyl oligopeptidase|nr:prolyl oligopeptidase family serine peptidase [Chthoniobacterales bacterium]
MKRSFLLLAATSLLTTFVIAEDKLFPYPPAPKGDQSDDYHGTKVADPYRDLENLDAEPTRKWIEAENKLTFDYLAAIPDRKKINEKMTALWDYEKYTIPFREGGRYFFSKNTGLQNQNVLFTASALPGEAKVLLDPNTLSKDGTVALSGIDITDDGKRLAYGIAVAGSDWQQWKVRDIESGKDLSDDVQWVKFSGASWTKDGSGFFYSRYDAPASADQLKQANYFHKLYFHKLGTPQSQDELVYERKDHKDWNFSGEVTEDGKFLVIYVSQGSDPKNMIFYKTLHVPKAPVVEMLNKRDAAWDFLGYEGDTVWLRTDLGAPRGRIVAISAKDPSKITTIVPEGADKLENAELVGNRFIVSYLKDARSVVRLYELNGKAAGEVALPGIGSASGFKGKRTDTETFYSFVSFTEPATIYRYDFKTGQSTPLFRPKVAFKSDDYTTEQVFYPSKDGTKIPMFLTYRKGLEKNGNNPTLLYGYGGFNASMTPSFSPSVATWLEMGGVYAVANLRGGGEYGEDWHLAGTKLKKQNVFDDFIAAGEWLIANKYTSTPKLAISGRSNGGLLVGAVLNQRPELWGATLPGVGVMDMLRFQKFTIGWAWTSDYGSSDNKDEFEAIYKYSPLHNIKTGTKYPPTFIVTADHDDRVYPGHSFKFAAALQAAQAGDAPVLIRIETRAGHGAGKPTSKIIEETTDQWAFLAKSLGMKLPF